MKSDFKEGRQGLAFKNGKLFEFTKRHVLVVTGGDDPRAWFKRRSHGWKATRKWADALFVSNVFADLQANVAMNVPAMAPVPAPDGPMVIDPEEEQRRARNQRWVYAVRRQEGILDGYRATIPPAIRSELARYRERLWQLYNALARCPGAFDLSRSNPALLFGLANNWVFHKPAVTQPLRSARRLVNRKQKVILEWLGFPGTEPVRRLMAKIADEALRCEPWRSHFCGI